MIICRHMPWKCGQELGQTLDARLWSWESGASPGRDALKVRGLAKWLGFHGISPGSYQCFTGYQYYMQYIIQYYYYYLLYIYMWGWYHILSSWSYGSTFSIRSLGLRIKFPNHCWDVWETGKLGDWLSLGHRIGVSNFYNHKTVRNCNHPHINQQKLSVQPTTFPTNHQ